MSPAGPTGPATPVGSQSSGVGVDATDETPVGSSAPTASPVANADTTARTTNRCGKVNRRARTRRDMRSGYEVIVDEVGSTSSAVDQSVDLERGRERRNGTGTSGGQRAGRGGPSGGRDHVGSLGQ